MLEKDIPANLVKSSGEIVCLSVIFVFSIGIPHFGWYNSLSLPCVTFTFHSRGQDVCICPSLSLHPSPPQSQGWRFFSATTTITKIDLALRFGPLRSASAPLRSASARLQWGPPRRQALRGGRAKMRNEGFVRGKARRGVGFRGRSLQLHTIQTCARPPGRPHAQ